MSATAEVRRTTLVTRLIAPIGFGLAGVFFLAAIAEIPLRHAIIDVSRGDIDGANRSFDAARALRPWDVDLPDVAAHAIVTYGLASGDRRSVDAAARWLDRVPGELRRDEQVALDVASLWEARGEYAAARSLLTEVLSRDRDNPAVLLQRGIVEAEAGWAEPAERDFLAAADVVPDDPGPWTNLAVLYQQQGRLADAAAARTRAAAVSHGS
jgi:tetratricopeptide (TPR) repeat protein